MLPSYLEEKVPKTKHYNAKNASPQYIHRYLSNTLSHSRYLAKNKNYHINCPCHITMINKLQYLKLN